MAVQPTERLVYKSALWGLWISNVAIISIFWLNANGANDLKSGDIWVIVHAIAQLAGLFATFCALTQCILMGRAGWLEPIFGLDRLAIFHRRNGMAAIFLMLLHSSFMVLSHAQLSGHDAWQGISQVIGLPYVWLAIIAEVLFLVTVGLSVYIVRKHLKFETWYAVHLLNYAAIVIVPFHQLANGTSFLLSPAFSVYWLGLYAITGLTLLIWRFGIPLLRFGYFQFRVDRIVKETPTATSVYIKGKHLERFRAQGGQFVLVRFLNKKCMWQEHPFSLSALPSNRNIRLTIRQLGDFTNQVPTILPGTPVVVSGPYGIFTLGLRRSSKIVYIAGGIGITPIRSIIEAQDPATESILLYASRTLKDAALLPEIEQLARPLNMTIHTVISEDPLYKGEKGYIDKEKLARLVPDITQRDVFLCGPPPMMQGIRKALAELNVPSTQVHYERFSLHKQ